MSDNNNEVIFTASQSADKPRGRTGFMILLFVTPVALLALGWFTWRQQQTLVKIQTEYQDLAYASTELSALRDTQSLFTSNQQKLEQQVALTEQSVQQLTMSQQQVQTSVQQQLQMAQASLNEQSTQLSAVNQELAALRANVDADAMRAQQLAEAIGMLRLAEQRLRLAADVDTAATIVRSVDSLLAQIGDSDINVVRVQLAGDLTDLQAVRPIDVSAVYQQLGNAITQLNTLTAISDSAVADMEVTPTASTVPAEPGWLNQTMDFLGQYFVITQRDEAITPLLSPQQVWFIRKSVELQLQQARLALLNGDSNLFKVALVEAQSSITSSLQGAEKAALLATLQQLQDTQLQVQLPSLTATIAALQRLQNAASPAARVTP